MTALSLLLAAFLIPLPPVANPVAAAEPDWSDRTPSPLRGGGWKDEGSGEAGAAEPTGRLIVRYREGTSAAQRDRARADARVSHVSDLALPNGELVMPAPGAAGSAMTRLAGSFAIESVEAEFRRRHQGGPTGEALFGQQWALHNIGQEVEGFFGVPDVDMNVPQAWDITTGAAELIVAVLDDGVDFSHPDLAGRAWVNEDEIANNLIDDDGNGFVDDVNGWDFCHEDNGIGPDGADTHGTHVAGSIAANGDGEGIAGVAPSVRIMSVKFLSDDPTCGADGQAINAIAYAVANGALIINASWGGPGASDALGDAIAAVPGALVVAAAGNGGTDSIGDDNDLEPIYPASYDLPNILSVTAIHNEGHLSSFSNVGFVSVDLAAPGEDILSTLSGIGGWGYGDGTSMAAANASGVAALAASAKPELLGDAPALREHLIATARALPSARGWVASPRLLDARAAVVSKPDIRRLAGVTNRYQTAVAISRATFVPGVPLMFIATGENYPDALAGGAVAAQLGVPLLLVKQGSIPPETRAEIERLQPFHIFVLGGTSSVSASVASQLSVYADTFRIANQDRFGTAAAISSVFTHSAPSAPAAFIANGLNFPDALAGAPATAAIGGPLLLVRPTSIPASTAAELDRINPQQIIVLGGGSSVSAAVMAQLDAYTLGPVTRIAGVLNRYETAAAIAQFAFPTSETAFVANGLNFPDALAGGPSGGAYGGPLLLTTPGSAQPALLQEMQRLQPARVFVLGGGSSVSQTVVNQINALFP